MSFKGFFGKPNKGCDTSHSPCQAVDKAQSCHPERSEAKSKDLKSFDILLICKILRHFVPQNDSVSFS